ncbi:MAG: CoA-binding protein [Candidatus Didemnitutus sp.]|nr:CoA-binding protein [Candidatus Didemnitutus sp.]
MSPRSTPSAAGAKRNGALPAVAHRPFVSEAEAYDLLGQADLMPPRHGISGGFLPFQPGEPVVLKGLGYEVWHKSELGAVRFIDFDAAQIATEAAGMRARIEAAGHEWLDGLVCERILLQRNGDLPSEGFASLSRTDAGWVALFGFGGLQADALAELAPVCRWPLAVMTPDEALVELEAHLLGRIWLGRLRATRPLTTPENLRQFLNGLWQLAAIAESEGLSLLEMNPVALDTQGTPRPLDAVGRRAPHAPDRLPPLDDFLEALRTPQRIALAGVSAKVGGVGRTILDNLRRYPLPKGDLVLIKPGQDRFLELPCLPDVGALLAAPVDLLLLALPAVAAADVLTTLIQQGGGATCVGLVAGGIGDGADTTGLGEKLKQLLHDTRAAGRWTPAILGPNFLGHWVPAALLDTSFIPTAKLAAPATTGGKLTLLSQSGAFLLCRRSRQPELPFGLGVALGNQMDVALGDVLAALSHEIDPGPVACYVEGFGPGQLAPFARSARVMHRLGAHVILHRAGRTVAGQAAAASHTGAMAGDLELERSLLERSGVHFTETIAEFDATLAWLSAYPQLAKGPVALLTNAGFESVNGSDLFGPDLAAAELSPKATKSLSLVLESHSLDGLVAPRLPLDLTPMAEEAAYLDAAKVLLPECAVLVVGLVPFTRNLGTEGVAAQGFATKLAALARAQKKPLAVVIDAGPAYGEYRAAFVQAGVPTFDRIENALLGLRVL